MKGAVFWLMNDGETSNLKPDWRALNACGLATSFSTQLWWSFWSQMASRNNFVSAAFLMPRFPCRTCPRNLVNQVDREESKGAEDMMAVFREARGPLNLLNEPSRNQSSKFSRQKLSEVKGTIVTDAKQSSSLKPRTSQSSEEFSPSRKPGPLSSMTTNQKFRDINVTPSKESLSCLWSSSHVAPHLRIDFTLQNCVTRPKA